MGAAAKESAKQLTWRLVASWIWTKQFWGPGLCLPVPSLLNIAQFLDEVPDCEHTEEEWLLTYVRAIQRLAEASGGHEWMNIYPHPMVCTADLVEAFMTPTEVWHEARDVAWCWGEPPDSHPTWPRVQEFAQVTAHLDSMAMQVPSQQAFDELVYPPYEPYELHNRRSCHCVVGGVMDLEESMPPTEVAVYNNGHLLSQGRGPLFKGWVLVYDLQNDRAE